MDWILRKYRYSASELQRNDKDGIYYVGRSGVNWNSIIAFVIGMVCSTIAFSKALARTITSGLRSSGEPEHSTSELRSTSERSKATEHSKPEPHTEPEHSTQPEPGSRRPEPGSSGEPQRTEPEHSKRPEHSTWELRSNGCSSSVSDTHIAVGSNERSGNRASR